MSCDKMLSSCALPSCAGSVIASLCRVLCQGSGRGCLSPLDGGHNCLKQLGKFAAHSYISDSKCWKSSTGVILSFILIKPRYSRDRRRAPSLASVSCVRLLS